MTNREVVSMIRSKLKQISGDDSISDRALLAELRSTANLYIKREVDKRKLSSVDSLFTTVPCLEMVEVPLAECCTYSSHCTIRKSKHKLPKIGESVYNYIVESVNSMDGSMSFSEGTANRYANSLSLGLKKHPKIYWLQNGHLYVSDSNIQYISLRAYFEEDVPHWLMSCDDNTSEYECQNPMDLPFRCPGYILQNVISTVENGYASIFLRVKVDETDNDNPNT